MRSTAAGGAGSNSRYGDRFPLIECPPQYTQPNSPTEQVRVCEKCIHTYIHVCVCVVNLESWFMLLESLVIL